MKIAYVIYDYTEKGGIERYIRELARSFVAQGHEVHIVSSRFGPPEPPIVYHRVQLPRFLPFSLKFILFTVKTFRALAGEYFDVIHSQGSDGLFHNVITVHNCHREYYERSTKRSVRELLIRMVRPIHRLYVINEKRNLARGSLVISVSSRLRDELCRHYGVPREMITVIPNGVDSRTFSPGLREQRYAPMRQSLGIADDAFVALFIANDPRRKGLSTALRSLALLHNPGVRLLVVGKVPAATYARQARKLGVGKNVVFVSPKDDVSAYYACSDVFLFPTRYEAFGMVITEAMASGLPVLVSKAAGAAALVDDARCLIENPFDAGEIKEKLSFLIAHPGERAAIGNAMRLVAEQYSWERAAAETMAVYRKAASPCEEHPWGK